MEVTMDFFGRQAELKLLEKIWQNSKKKARMVVITGRRRIGKTYLATTFAKNKPHLYLFVAKKTEALLCQEFIQQIKEAFQIPIFGEIKTFREIFTLLLEIGKKQHFVLIIDEIQEFLTINASIYSDMQELWDRYLFQSQLQLILMGSIHSLMQKIFEDSKEPLFGRADRILHLKPFSIMELYEILKGYKKNQSETLFFYYLISGGIPKYIEQLLFEEAFSEEKILKCVFSEHSPFLYEGKLVLVEEFGKEYGMYFSILELIAAGKTSRNEIESILQKDVGGFLDRLDTYYSVIEKYRPIIAKPQSKSVKYRIKDLFLRFWFRFIFTYWSAIETSNFSYVREVLARDLSTYKGTVLETFFKELFAESKYFNQIGSYWEHGNQNEIDLVAINDLKKQIFIGEVKLNRSRFRKETLKQKAEKLLQQYADYTPEFLVLSLDDIEMYLPTGG